MLKKMQYCAENSVLLPLIATDAKRILDVGCGTGSLAKAIKSRQSVCVTGITYSEDERALAQAYMDDVWLGDINSFDFSQVGQFDCIICSHVLEHLYDPWAVLRALREQLRPGGVVIVALPNTVEIKTRLRFVTGRFRYTDWGVLDRTHYRFFDYGTARELVEGAGFTIEYQRAYGFCPLPFVRSFLGPAAAKIDDWASKIWPGLLGVQFVFKGRLAAKSWPPEHPKAAA